MGQCVVEPEFPTESSPVKAVAGGIGPLNDGDYWRRLRIVMEGTFWETFEYRWNFALENNPVQHGWAR